MAAEGTNNRPGKRKKRHDDRWLEKMNRRFDRLRGAVDACEALFRSEGNSFGRAAVIMVNDKGKTTTYGNGLLCEAVRRSSTMRNLSVMMNSREHLREVDRFRNVSLKIVVIYQDDFLKEGRRFKGAEVRTQALLPGIADFDRANKETMISLLGRVVGHLRGGIKFRRKVNESASYCPPWWPSEVPFRRIDNRGDMAQFPDGNECCGVALLMLICIL